NCDRSNGRTVFLWSGHKRPLGRASRRPRRGIDLVEILISTIVALEQTDLILVVPAAVIVAIAGLLVAIRNRSGSLPPGSVQFIQLFSSLRLARARTILHARQRHLDLCSAPPIRYPLEYTRATRCRGTGEDS